MSSMTKTLELIKAKGGVEESIKFVNGQIDIYEDNGWLPGVIAMWEGHLSNLLKIKEMESGDQ